MKKRTLVFVLVFVLIMIPLSMNACSSQPKLDDALLEFPGLKWGDTPEQVIEKLKLTEDQILDNAMEIPAEDSAETVYDVWNLVITDWTFLDSEVVGAYFTFIRYPDRNFGLMNVQLYLAEDTDMNALREEMADLYGAGSADPKPYYTIWDGKIEKHESIVKQTEDGFPYYWYATVTGTEVLSAQAVEEYVEYMTNSDMPASREVVIEYLDKVPVVQLACATKNLAASSLEKIGQSIPYITNNTVIYTANQIVHLLQQFEN